MIELRNLWNTNNVYMYIDKENYYSRERETHKKSWKKVITIPDMSLKPLADSNIRLASPFVA